MTNNSLAVDIAVYGSAIAAGITLFAFAPALVRFQIRMLEWQIDWMKQSWATWPLRFFGAAFALLGLTGLIFRF